nr:LysE family translocator [Pseudoalteromonas caenipelagi]
MGLFALSMSISPGPVNLIALAAGANQGTKKAMPFVSGATIGFTLLLYLLGLSFYQLIAQYSTLLNVLGVFGSAFIFYMGYQLMMSRSQLKIVNGLQPRFTQGFLLQWLNPKAWGACIAGISAFNLSQSHQQLLQFVSIYFVVCYLSIAAWAVFGDKLSCFLNDPQRLKFFNVMMGGCLILIALYLVTQQLLSVLA